MPRIVVLDAYTLTPAHAGERPADGEPHWQAIEQLGDLTVHMRTDDDGVAERARGAEIVLTNKAPLTAATIDALDALEYVGVLATGTNVVDLDAATRRGVTVTNVPGYSGPSVAQHTIALLLELTNHVARHSDAVHDGAWSRCPDFSLTLEPIVELADKTIGIVGIGDIGQRVARIVHALGMRIAVNSRSRRELDVPVQWMEPDELFAACDVISLHCPLTDATRHLVNHDRLERMKPAALLLNTSRGPLVDEAALASALNAGRIAGAAVDVLSEEPPAQGSPLIGAPRCIITPHNAWAARESRWRLMQIAARNVEAYLAGAPVNVVNP